MSQHLAANVEAFAAVATAGLAIVLAVVSFISYRRIRHRRPLFIGLAFAAFAAQGIYLVWQANMYRGTEPWILWVSLMDLLILGLLYFAIKTR